MEKIIIKILLISLFLNSISLFAFEGTILVAYYSKTGHTAEMAKAVAEGAGENNQIRVIIKKVEESTSEDIMSADAIIVGSPVYNGNVAPQVQKFINNWPFRGQPMKDKIGAAFCTAGGISAGEETVQLSILRSMLVFNMIVVGGPDWKSAFGASAITGEIPFDLKSKKIDEIFLQKGRDLGRRVAELVLKLSSKE